MKRLTLLTFALIGVGVSGAVALGGQSLLDRLTSADERERQEAGEQYLLQRNELIRGLVAFIEKNADEKAQWGPGPTQTKTAVDMLGELRPPWEWVVDALVKHLNTGRNIEEGFDSSAWPSSWGPNTVASALIKIGKPSVPPVLDVLAETTDTEIARQCGLIIRSVEGKEVGRFILEKAMEREEDPQKRANLERALPFFRGGEASAQLPLETALETAKALFNQGCEMNAPYMLSSGEEYAKGRREFIVPMLKALKVLLDNGVPPEEAQPQLPAVNRYDIFPRGPEYEAAVKEHEAEMEARRKARLLLDAWQWRLVLTQGIAGYYSNPPYATEELRQLAVEILKDDAVVSALVQRVEANIARNTAGQTSTDKP